MLESSDFKKWWLNQNVDYEKDFQKRLWVESMGELIFDFCSFDVSSNPKIKIAVHSPWNEHTAEKLKREQCSNS